MKAIIYKITNKINGKAKIVCFGSNNINKSISDAIYRLGLKNNDCTCEPLVSVLKKEHIKNLVSYFALYYNTIEPNGYNSPSKSMSSVKKCFECNIEKTNKWFIDNLKRHCSGCHKRFKRKCDPEYNKKILEYKKRYRLKHPQKVSEQKKQSRIKKLDQYKKRTIDRYWANPVKAREEKKKWYNNGGKLIAEANAKTYKHKKKNRTPKWLTKKQKKEIQNIYKNRPDGYHVDHIVPINGVNVSGLHVPWNLQYLTAQENIAKKNKF